jgi:hypothetical protein
VPPNRPRRRDDDDDDDYDDLPRPRRRYDDDEDEDDVILRRMKRRRRKSQGLSPWVWVGVGLGGIALALIVLVAALASSRGKGGGEYGDDPNSGGVRPGNVAANMEEFRSPAAISAKLGAGRVVPPDELDRMVFEQTDASGKVTARRSVADAIRMPNATYYHWGTKSEDLYVAFPNRPDRLSSSRAIWQGRTGKQKDVMTGSGGVDP